MALQHTDFRFDLDIPKYKDVCLYLLKCCDNEIHGKKKLAKLLYFCEFDFYEKHEEQLTGETFIKQKMGPYPENLDALVKTLSKESKIKINEKQNKLDNNTVVYSLINNSYSFNLEEEEMAMIERVANKYRGLTGTDLEHLSHQEAPWNAVNKYEVINCELALYRDTDFSDLRDV